MVTGPVGIIGVGVVVVVVVVAALVVLAPGPGGIIGGSGSAAGAA